MSDYDAAANGAACYALAIATMRDKLESLHKVQIGACTLYRADCRDVLPLLPRVDAVVTDPPYGIKKKLKSQDGPNSKRVLNFAWDTPLINEIVFSAVGSACEKAAAFFIFCGVSQVSHLEELLDASFTVKPAVWVKACPPPAAPGNWWPSGFELAVYGFRSGAFFGDTETSRSNVFYTDTYRHGIRADEKVDHPTQKWLPLFERIVSSIAPRGGTVLDPFMGSGTTGVACVKLGRKFIGIEIDPAYFDIACRRIEKAYAQPDLFVAPPVTEIQTSFLEAAP